MIISTLVSLSGIRLAVFWAVLSFITVVLATVACGNGGAKSTPSVTWTRVPHDEAAFGGRGFLGMSSVTAGGPGLVAVGRDLSDRGEAAVWTSVDGISWSRVPRDEAALGGPNEQEMYSVTTGGPGLVAVGRDESVGSPDAAVWTSADGISWSRVPHDEAVFSGESAQWMRSVTAGGPGLVAVGLDLSGGGSDAGVLTFSDWDAAVWVMAGED